MTIAAQPYPLVMPDDEHNRVLASLVHPSDWASPRPAGRYNLVVIGAGTAGLVSAVGAASLGARVALVEGHLMGGDFSITGACHRKGCRLRGERPGGSGCGRLAATACTGDS